MIEILNYRLIGGWYIMFYEHNSNVNMFYYFWSKHIQAPILLHFWK